MAHESVSQKQELEFECIEPESGRDLLLDYCSKQLNGKKLVMFELHRQACHYCAEKVDLFWDAVRLLAESSDSKR